MLKAAGVFFESEGNGVWRLTYQSKIHRVTFLPEVYEEQPSLRLMNFGDRLFEGLLKTAIDQPIPSPSMG